ncbi:MAG: hypothetical protein WCT49_00085 [Candidatus Paceibacterota bacterium]|jgi:hypothetical protein|nr:hypothetical protein [Candidatus Paceibacterota bacterium]
MKNNYHYLSPSKKQLLFGYGIIYFFFAQYIIFSELPFLQSTFWFWIVCGTLYFLERKGTYFLIQDDKLKGKASFLNGKDIPLKKIRKLTVGQSEVVIFHPYGLKLVFEDEFGNVGQRVLVFRRFEIPDMEKFIRDLCLAAPNITVDEELYTQIKKKKEKAKQKKTISDYFSVD